MVPNEEELTDIRRKAECACNAKYGVKARERSRKVFANREGKKWERTYQHRYQQTFPFWRLSSNGAKSKKWCRDGNQDGNQDGKAESGSCHSNFTTIFLHDACMVRYVVERTSGPISFRTISGHSSKRLYWPARCSFRLALVLIFGALASFGYGRKVQPLGRPLCVEL